LFIATDFFSLTHRLLRLFIPSSLSPRSRKTTPEWNRKKQRSGKRNCTIANLPNENEVNKKEERNKRERKKRRISKKTSVV